MVELRWPKNGILWPDMRSHDVPVHCNRPFPLGRKAKESQPAPPFSAKVRTIFEDQSDRPSGRRKWFALQFGWFAKLAKETGFSQLRNAPGGHFGLVTQKKNRLRPWITAHSVFGKAVPARF